MRKLKLGLFVAMIGVAALAACSEDTTKPKKAVEPEPYLRPTSPENTLANFRAAHLNQDIAAYSEAIATTFEFRSADGNIDDLNKSADEASVSNMFDEARSIELRLEHTGAVSSEYLDEFAPDDGYMQIAVPAIRLRVETTRDEGQGPITYLVDGDRALFMFVETSPGVWQIVMQEDQG